MTGTNEVSETARHAHDDPQDPRKLVSRANNKGLFITSVPKWIACAVIAWQARVSIEAMTGKNGIASLLERFGREASYWEVVCWVAGIAGVLFGIYSRHLLKRQLAHDSTRLDSLESRSNPISGSTLAITSTQAAPNERD